MKHFRLGTQQTSNQGKPVNPALSKGGGELLELYALILDGNANWKVSAIPSDFPSLPSLPPYSKNLWYLGETANVFLVIIA